MRSKNGSPAARLFSIFVFFKRFALFGGVIWAATTVAVAQSQPNLENGFKHYGSYDFHGVDTVNTMNGNLMLHAPLVPDYPQRGKLTPHYNLYVTSKNWQVRCVPNTDGGEFCFWASGGTGVTMQTSLGVTLHRTYDKFGTGTGTVSYSAMAYSLTSADGATHQLYPIPGTADSQGEATKFETIDTAGYRVEMSGPDMNGVLSTFTVTDRQGNQYIGTFTGGFAPGTCGRPQTNQMQAPGAYAPVVDDSPLGDQYCSQFAIAQQVTDSNGNRLTFVGSDSPGGLPNTWTDTLGRTAPLNTGAAGDFSGCVSQFTLVRADIRYYHAPDGSTQSIKLCYADVPVQTAFNQAGVAEAQSAGSAYATTQLQQVVTVLLADGSKWTFNYDSYGELISAGLPTGGSISYTWTTIGYPNCTGTDHTRFSRAVVTRTVNDNHGQVSLWQYAWGNPSSTTMVNTVTDAVSNDTVHTFTALDTQSNGGGGCGFYETQTQVYQGTGSVRQLLKQVDTSYAHAFVNVDDSLSGLSLGNVGGQPHSNYAVSQRQGESGDPGI